MKVSWILTLGLVFLIGFGLPMLLGGRQSNATSQAVGDGSSGETAMCEGCGDSPYAGESGHGRRFGEIVQAPMDGPFVSIAYRDDCVYCLVPVAVAIDALEQLRHTCPAAEKMPLVLFPTGVRTTVSEPTLLASLEGSRLSKSILWAVESASEWLDTLSTSFAPAVLIVNGSNKVVGGWLGFDPGHSSDLVTAIELSTGCREESGSEVPIIRSGLATTSEGDLVPTWVLDELGLSDKLPALVAFTDRTCALCQLMEPNLASHILPEIATDLTVMVVDSTASDEHLESRMSTLSWIGQSSPIGALLDLQEYEDGIIATGSRSRTWDVPVHEDGHRSMVTTLAGGAVPSALTIDLNGRVHSRLIYSANDTHDLYLERIISASAAVAAEYP